MNSVTAFRQMPDQPRQLGRIVMARHLESGKMIRGAASLATRRTR